MSHYRITVRRCNGCGNTDMDGAEIVQTELRYESAYDSDEDVLGGPTVDICADCAAQDRYICRLCKKVHDDAHPCEEQQILVEQAERYAHHQH